MPSFSQVSKDRLATCHPKLQALLNEAIKHYDFTVLCGHRGKDEQDAAYNSGRSKVRWPDSKHNRTPSLAVDVAPYPVDWSDLDRFRRLAWFLKGLGLGLGADLRLGADWDGDNDITDQTFHDLPHVELINYEGDY